MSGMDRFTKMKRNICLTCYRNQLKPKYTTIIHFISWSAWLPIWQHFIDIFFVSSIARCQLFFRSNLSVSSVSCSSTLQTAARGSWDSNQQPSNYLMTCSTSWAKSRKFLSRFSSQSITELTHKHMYTDPSSVEKHLLYIVLFLFFHYIFT